MFGGGYANDRSTSETWAYDYNSNTWENLNPPISPPARIGHEMVYDVQSEKLILVGGRQDLLQGSLFYNDVWSYHYETNTWTNVTPAINPQARWYFSMVYDVNADRTILLGGYTVFDWNSLIIHQGFKGGDFYPAMQEEYKPLLERHLAETVQLMIIDEGRMRQLGEQGEAGGNEAQGGGGGIPPTI